MFVRRKKTNSSVIKVQLKCSCLTVKTQQQSPVSHWDDTLFVWAFFLPPHRCYKYTVLCSPLLRSHLYRTRCDSTGGPARSRACVTCQRVYGARLALSLSRTAVCALPCLFLRILCLPKKKKSFDNLHLTPPPAKTLQTVTHTFTDPRQLLVKFCTCFLMFGKVLKKFQRGG